MAKKLKLDQDSRAPKAIKKKVQSRLDNYRLIGEVSNLYVDGLLQTLIGFAELIESKPTPNQLDPPKND